MASSFISGAPSTTKARCWTRSSPQNGTRLRLKLLKRILKKYGRPRKIVTDGLCSYSAAMKEVGAADRHEVGRRLNNRAENSHQPFDDGSGRCSGFEA